MTTTLPSETGYDGPQAVGRKVSRRLDTRATLKRADSKLHDC
jgi:hypothetical protein